MQAAAGEAVDGTVTDRTPSARLATTREVGKSTSLWERMMRGDLLSKFIENLETPCLVDTHRLRQRLVDALGEVVRTKEHELAISAVDVETGQVVRYVSRETPFTTSPEYIVADGGITVDM